MSLHYCHHGHRVCSECQTPPSTTEQCDNCARISASMTFKGGLLEGLYREAEKGRGTDLEVLCPAGMSAEEEAEANMQTGWKDVPKKTKAFHVHHTIVAASSGYFRTFPEPKSGRVIDDVDADSFAICLRFMYLGECDGRLTHENVASILNAAELLQISELKKHCLEYLERHLDHGNYAQVVELAERFNSPKLKMTALRFKTKSSARDEIVAKRAELAKVIGETSFTEKLAACKRYHLKGELRKIDEQWKSICQEELQLEVSAAEVSPWDNFCSLMSSGQYKSDFNESSSVGHLVRPYDPENLYTGSSTYGEESSEEECSNSEDADDYPYSPKHATEKTNCPPTPTEEQYKEYGILHSHCTLEGALQAAKAGDRIFLAPGVHKVGQSAYYAYHVISVQRAQEFIGMGKPDEVVVEVDYGQQYSFINVVAGPVGFFNITFRANAYEKKEPEGRVSAWHHPGMPSDPSANHALIDFDERTSPSDYEEPLKNELMVKNCIFDLGTDAEQAFPTRVSGIFLKRGKSATIEGCQFLGGAGSAIAVVSDPYWYIPNVQITRNKFVGNGLPTFSEKSVEHKSNYGCSGKPPYSDEISVRPIPVDQIPPGPASVEFLKNSRKPYLIKSLGYEEKPQTVTVKMEGNDFVSNLRAPLASRVCFPCDDDRIPWTLDSKRNTWHLQSGIADEAEFSDLAKGFKLTVSDNTMRGNGLQFDQAFTMMKLSSEIEAKEVRSENEESPKVERKKARIEGKANQERKAKYPDGNSMLVINHFLFDMYQGFPTGWEHGEPCENFEEDFLECIPCKRRNSYDSWGW